MFDWRSRFTESNFSWSEIEKTHVLETLASKFDELNHTETAWGWSPSKKVLASTEMFEVRVPLSSQYFPVVSYVAAVFAAAGPTTLFVLAFPPKLPSTYTLAPVVWGVFITEVKVVSMEVSPAGGSSS